MDDFFLALQISDLDLMDPNRQIIHKGYLRQPDNVQVYVFLFDNYRSSSLSVCARPDVD